MPEELDLRGLKCPEPAIMTGKALREHSDLVVIVDDEEAVQNISRGVKKRGYALRVERDGEDIRMHICRDAGPVEGDIEADLGCGPARAVVFFPSEAVGNGDDDLGRLLAKSILYSLREVEPKPSAIIFMNSGVKLAVNGSESLEDLNALKAAGVDILVCGTCLDYMQLKEELAVGEVSNAYTISETLLGAPNVVRF